ncbi:MAG: hypothetical protein SAJ12_03795 [Jaaginema sp. PMC 1079.18]|nr:hypothetical protein [Jaaginema sp. PMC 1080.18]MEC4850112.1 hypothetical protein [Jaaginema sp. PMC 1079.18]MEC4864800.1 hypothetical protein [Jaaginema sp. PMC 1078.18]
MTKAFRKMLKQQATQTANQLGTKLREIPESQFPPDLPTGRDTRLKVWGNRDFLVQLFDYGCGLRLSVCRTKVKGFGKNNNPIWKDNISWDELQAIKAEVGYADTWACELYPPEEKIVNVANIRHLWIMKKPPNDMGWH